jgi:prephenate dehydrogenase
VTSIRAITDAVVVGGSGAVGALLVDSLVAAGVATLHVVDRRSPASRSGVTPIHDDICRPSDSTLRLIETTELVILATPEQVAIEGVRAFLPRMKQGSLLVDTLSVKSRFAQALATVHRRAEVLGINPMFAPSLGFAGRSVVAVPYAAGDLAEAFLDFICSEGASVMRLNAEEHDRACAALQVATHAAVLSFGVALRAAGYDLAAVEKIAPPPHRTMLALLARILGADPEVYRDIQAANPFAAEMRAQLAAALRHLDEVVGSDDAEPFHRLIGELRSLFDDTSTNYAALCARLFEVDSGGQ